MPNNKNNSKIIIIILLSVIVLLSGVIVFLLLTKPKDIEPVERTDNSLSFETVDKRFWSDYAEEKKYVITNNRDWSDLWYKVYLPDKYSKIDLPKVDFTKEIVIAVFQGEKNKGGYLIEIKKIVEDKQDLNVYVNEISPHPRAAVTFAFTRPYHIIKLQKTGKKVKFITTKTVLYPTR